ncbi:MAG: DUF58 domain-containing protein [Lachnospiraceae bacterium]|nr:DUF58 domain-containing protein [Lachnospiraceae bacterium]
MIILILLLAAAILYFAEKKIYAAYWKKGLDIKVNFDEHSAFEGDTSTLTEVVENRSFLPLPFIHAKFHVGSGLLFEDRENMATSDANYKNDIFSILFFQRITRTLKFTCTGRGFYRITDAALVSTDLFYKLHLLDTRPLDTFFYVYPGRVDISRFEQPLRKMVGEMNSRQFLYPDPFEFRGLRTYTISDPMNTINWKASARMGELMVNQYDSTTTRKIVILLNLENETVIARDILHEESIRIACTLCGRLLSEGYPIGLRVNGRDVETLAPTPYLQAQGPAQLEDLYRTLARIDMSEKDKPEFAPFIRDLMQEPDFNTSGYVLVSACQNEEIQEAYRELSREAAALWVSPMFMNMQPHVQLDNDDELIRWEVEGYA